MQLLRSENSWFLPPESAMIFSEAVYSLLEGIWCWILPKMGIWARWVSAQIHLDSSGSRRTPLERGVSSVAMSGFCHLPTSAESLPLPHSITRLLGCSDWASSFVLWEQMSPQAKTTADHPWPGAGAPQPHGSAGMGCKKRLLWQLG